jgi:hypothetical protein
VQRVLRWPAWSKIAHLEERVAALESRRTGHENLSLAQRRPTRPHARYSRDNSAAAELHDCTGVSMVQMCQVPNKQLS